MILEVFSISFKHLNFHVFVYTRKFFIFYQFIYFNFPSTESKVIKLLWNNLSELGSSKSPLHLSNFSSFVKHNLHGFIWEAVS